MHIEIVSYGTGSRYAVDFTRDDVCALEKFLSDKGVFLSDRQVALFAETGEGVQFHRAGRRFVAAVIVRDITEQVQIDKARDIIRKFLARKDYMSPTFISRAKKVKQVADAYNLTHML